MAQNKISRRSFLRGAGASATIAAASCMAPSAAACDIKSLWSMDLQILATSDTHGKFDPWDYAANKADASGSVAQQATAIKQCRTRNTLVVDAGDTIQANSAELFLNDDLHPMIAAMNAIGYDIWTTGNHEYNYGMDVLKKVMGQQKAKVLTGNVYAPDGTRWPMATPSSKRAPSRSVSSAWSRPTSSAGMPRIWRAGRSPTLWTRAARSLIRSRIRWMF